MNNIKREKVYKNKRIREKYVLKLKDGIEY